MQSHVTTEHLESMVANENFAALGLPKRIIPDKIAHLSQHGTPENYADKYFDAIGRIHVLMCEYREPISRKPVMFTLLQKLLDMLQEAASGNLEALKHVTSSGRSTLEGVLTMLKDENIREYAPKDRRAYAELRERLTNLEERYF